MYSIVKTTHSYVAWAVLILLVITVIYAALTFFGKKSWKVSEFKLAFFTFVSCHIQLLLGLVLYFTSPFGMSNLSGETMKDSFSRLLAVEHPFVNILGIVMISVGYIKAKKLLDTVSAPKTIFIYYGIGLLLFLSRIPWSNWL